MAAHPRTPTRMPLEAGRHRRMAGVADLGRLALAAVGRAPERPLRPVADHVHRPPEPRADPGVRRVAQHPPAPPVRISQPSLAAELEVQPAVVDRPGPVGVHEDPVLGRGDHLRQRRVARQQPDVGHPHHRQPGPAVGPDHPAVREAGHRAGVPPGQHPGPDPVPDDVLRRRRRALVVVPERAERAGQRRVGGDRHEVGAEPQRPELGQVQPGRPGVRGLPAEDPVQLGRVPDRLVDLQRHLLAAEDQRRSRRPGTPARSAAPAPPRRSGPRARAGRARGPAPSRGCRTARGSPGTTGAGSRPRRSRSRSSPRRTPAPAGRSATPRWTRTTSWCPRPGRTPRPGTRRPPAWSR